MLLHTLRGPPTPAQPSTCPVWGNTTSYLFIVRNETQEETKHAKRNRRVLQHERQQREICGEKRGQGTATWRGILPSCKGKLFSHGRVRKLVFASMHLTMYLHALKPSSRTRTTTFNLAIETALLQSCHYCHGKNTFQLCRNSRPVLPITHIWYSGSSTGIFTSEL